MKRPRPSRHGLTVAILMLVGLAAAWLVLSGVSGGNGFDLISSHADSSYLFVALLVFGDAVIPIFPGETTVNAAATVAAGGALSLPLVMLAAALGAIVGDSTLYWLARCFGGRLRPRIERARENEKVALVLGLLGNRAPLLLTAGRFVPGVRFAVNAMLGTTRYPYRRFLLWSALGGSLWAVYTCLLAYAVATVLDNFPLASTVISGVITTVLLGVVLWSLRRQHQESVGAGG